MLADFLARGIEEYPAERYALILTDHGGGWPGVGPDESAGHDILDLQEIHDGIAAGLEAAGLDKLDLLGFDACLMATYETASAMAPLADRMLASQELEPGHGWDYRVLSNVAENPGITVDEVDADRRLPRPSRPRGQRARHHPVADRPDQDGDARCRAR